MSGLDEHTVKENDTTTEILTNDVNFVANCDCSCSLVRLLSIMMFVKAPIPRRSSSIWRFSFVSVVMWSKEVSETQSSPISTGFWGCRLGKYTRCIGVHGRRFIHICGKCRGEPSIKNLAPSTTLKQNIFVSQQYCYSGEYSEDTCRLYITEFLEKIKMKFFAKSRTLRGKLWEWIISEGFEMIFENAEKDAMPFFIMLIVTILAIWPEASSEPRNPTQHDCKRCTVENAIRDVDRDALGRMFFIYLKSSSAKQRCCMLSEWAWVVFIDMRDIFNIFFVRFLECRPQLRFHFLSCVQTCQSRKIWGEAQGTRVITPKSMETESIP